MTLITLRIQTRAARQVPFEADRTAIGRIVY